MICTFLLFFSPLLLSPLSRARALVSKQSGICVSLSPLSLSRGYQPALNTVTAYGGHSLSLSGRSRRST